MPEKQVIIAHGRILPLSFEHQSLGPSTYTRLPPRCLNISRAVQPRGPGIPFEGPPGRCRRQAVSPDRSVSTGHTQVCASSDTNSTSGGRSCASLASMLTRTPWLPRRSTTLTRSVGPMRMGIEGSGGLGRQAALALLAGGFAAVEVPPQLPRWLVGTNSTTPRPTPLTPSSSLDPLPDADAGSEAHWAPRGFACPCRLQAGSPGRTYPARRPASCRSRAAEPGHQQTIGKLTSATQPDRVRRILHGDDSVRVRLARHRLARLRARGRRSPGSRRGRSAIPHKDASLRWLTGKPRFRQAPVDEPPTGSTVAAIASSTGSLRRLTQGISMPQRTRLLPTQASTWADKKGCSQVPQAANLRPLFWHLRLDPMAEFLTSELEWAVGRRYFRPESVQKLTEPSNGEVVKGLLELESA
jgi:hypothetical protein